MLIYYIDGVSTISQFLEDLALVARLIPPADRHRCRPENLIAAPSPALVPSTLPRRRRAKSKKEEREQVKSLRFIFFSWLLQSLGESNRDSSGNSGIAFRSIGKFRV
ncbi:uncharacterized protein HKW66_Vig0076390 [Vigna angularis]|uniref:Uncharacterized protein n=1 Tax=Phaseolus angularis TaxID=3914 RepID=A0A8T0K5V1_PHAAN|nr:uncharacterized protein HKW66_Vig0076390 [Vigna angularis]